ncbi:hypothetical protein IAD21_00210 [Abditibacteriota bacterium]|nr:hypothetical protein IAD21_00210 [Abditibacteriota bacterium]
MEAVLNFLFANALVCWVWLVIPLALPLVSFHRLHRHPPTIRIVVSFLLAIAAAFVCFLVPLSWILRDGLGPDAVESHAGEAFSRFLEGVAPCFSICAVPCGIALFLYVLSERDLRRCRP